MYYTFIRSRCQTYMYARSTPIADLIFPCYHNHMFTDLDLGLNITLTIIVILAGIFILSLIMSSLFIFYFSRVVKKDHKALVVILATKYEYLRKVYEISGKINGFIDPEVKKELDYFNLVNLEEPSSAEFKTTIDKLTFLRNKMDFLSRSQEIYSKHEEFKRAKTSVEEMDIVYQAAIATYNNDINAYNYWIRFLPCRLLYWLIGFKKKEII